MLLFFVLWQDHFTLSDRRFVFHPEEAFLTGHDDPAAASQALREPVTEADRQLLLPVKLVQRALPLSTSAALLQCLIDVWLEISEAAACYVSLVLASTDTGSHLEWAFARAGCQDAAETGTQPIEPDSVQWSATRAGDHLLSIFSDVREQRDLLTVVAFEFDGVSLGGVLLRDSANDTSSFGVLAEVSSRLIAQFHAINAGHRQEENAGHQQEETATPDAAPESKLRDLKLEAMAEFAAGAGHEINNPVATIAGRTALLLKSETDPETRRILETIGGQAYRIRDMIGDAMTFARPPKPVFERFRPASESEAVIDTFRRQFASSQIEVTADLDESIELTADREQFRAVVSCLVKNALEAAGNRGRVIVQLAANDSVTESNQEEMSRSEIFLSATDSGPGLSATEREHLFDPFFSGRQAGRGLGFGLSKCWQIVRQHGGSIEVDNNDQPGLTIVSRWPAEPHRTAPSVPGSDNR